MTDQFETVTLGGGCFWCLEAVFQELTGIEQVVSGYAGGTVHQPTYQQICTGTTGHAEVVQVTFNPAVLSFEDLLHVFWRIHDPTTLNRQGADAGPQYRSVIFYHTPTQKEQAEQSKAHTDAAGLWPNPIVTFIEPLTQFYPAEGYHQNYFRQNPYQGYCQMVINPKLKKFRAEFAARLRA
jgi:peptide-methionine (S)-S-oxide reductase